MITHSTRKPGNVEIEDLFRTRHGGDSALLKRIQSEGRDPKKTNRWRVRWVDYDRKQKTKSFRRKEDAKAFKDHISAQLVRGDYVDLSLGEVTVETMHKRWKAAAAHTALHTQQSRDSAWRNHVQPRWGAVALKDVRKGDVQEWIVSHAQETGLGESSLNLCVEVLRLVLKHAVESKHIHTNPAVGISVPKDGVKERYYLTVKQVEALANELPANYGTLIRVFAYCGLRWAEGVGLRVQDIDFKRSRLSIHQTITAPKGKAVIKPPKNYERRSVPFPALLTDGLKLAVAGKKPGDLAFQAPEGGPLLSGNFHKREYKPAKQRAGEKLQGFPAVTIHDLRHTAASLAISSGANVKVLQRMLGHKSAALTLDTYADLFETDLDEVAVKMSALITSQA